MCSRHDAVQLEPPKAAPPPGPRTGGLCQLVRIVVRGTFPAPSDESVPVFSGFLVLCRAEAENCGAWVRRSWHRTAPTSLPFLLYLRRIHPCHSNRSCSSGARLRELPRLRCLEQIACFEEGAAGAAPRGDGSVAGGLVMICSDLSAPNAMVVDCRVPLGRPCY
jgi:hypothetical protein